MSLQLKLRLIVLVTALAATQLLSQQLARGQSEAFLPQLARPAKPIDLELRDAVVASGTEVKLKQIVHWSSENQAIMANVAELVVLRVPADAAFATISLEQLKSVLFDAGLNQASMNYLGAGSCTVSRSDKPFDEARAMQDWVERGSKPIGTLPNTPGVDAVASNASNRTLGDLLRDDLAKTLELPVDSIDLQFDKQLANVINLPEGVSKLEITPRRTAALGVVSWMVEMQFGDRRQKLIVSGIAKAWQEQLIAVRPLNLKQPITESDVSLRRTLSSTMHKGKPPTLDSVLGMQAARKIIPGDPITLASFEAVTLVRTGDLVTITLKSSDVEIRAVGKAMGAGTRGQRVQLRNEQTRQTYDAVVTGPREALVDLNTGLATISE